MANVSLIISCHNQQSYLKQLFRLLKNYGWIFEEMEVLLIDSSSESSVIPDVVNLYRLSNKGPSVARNYGATKAGGDWIVFCDADDLISPMMLQFLRNSGIYNEADALFFPYRRAYDEVIFKEASDYYKGQTFSEKVKSVEINNPVYFLKNFFPVHAVAVKRHLFDQVRFNEKQWFIEDVRFYAELAMLPHARLFYINEPAFTSFHRDFRERASLSTSNDAEYWKMICANYEYVAANYHVSLRDKLTLVKLLVINYHLVNSVHRPYLKKYCNNIWNYFLGIPRLFQNRLLYSGISTLYRLIKPLK